MARKEDENYLFKQLFESIKNSSIKLLTFDSVTDDVVYTESQKASL